MRALMIKTGIIKKVKIINYKKLVYLEILVLNCVTGRSDAILGVANGINNGKLKYPK